MHTHDTTTPSRADADKHHGHAKDAAAPTHHAEAVAHGASAAAAVMAASEQRHASGAQPSVSQGQPHSSSARTWEEMKGEGASPEVRGSSCIAHIAMGARATAHTTAECARGCRVLVLCRRRR